MRNFFALLAVLAFGCGGPPLDAAFAGTWTGTETIHVDGVGTYGPTLAQFTVTVSGNDAKVAGLCPGGVITATGSRTSATWAITYTEAIGPPYDPVHPDIRPIIQQPSISCPPMAFTGADGGTDCRDATLYPEHASVSLTRLASHEELTIVATGIVWWCQFFQYSSREMRIEFIGTKEEAGGAGARHPEQDAFR